MRFAGRLVVGTVFVAALTLLVLILGAERTLRSSLQDDLAITLEREAHFVGELLPDDPRRWSTTITRLAAQSGHRIVLRDSTGAVLAQTDSIRADHLLTQRAPTSNGIAEVSASLDGIAATVDSARGSMIAASLLAILVAFGLAALTGRSVSRPLEALAETAEAIASGKPPRFPHSGISEIDTLVQALRAMHRQLGDRFAELQREKGEGAAMVDAMVEGVIATDARGNIVTANPAARRMLGYGAKAPLPGLQSLFRVKAARSVVETVLSGESVEDREVDLDGTTVMLNARPLATGGAVLVLHDLTEIRHLEEVRRDFVANVSHELKTPLTSITGYAETLTEGGVDADTTQRFLVTILANSRRMLRLVDDLLDLSRIEAGRWVPRPTRVDLESVWTECCTLFQDRAAQRQVQFNRAIATDARHVVVDSDAIRQILSNLIDNALRYVPIGGEITCRVTHRGNGTDVAVQDNGSGIPEEHLSRIFERFYRADPSRSRAEGGTGLGLSIVRHMVEAHGGTLSVTSTLGIGTTVLAHFPAADAAPEPSVTAL